MPLTLILTRHAKSSWDDPDIDDFHRPLNKRGCRDAPRIGRWLSENGVFPAQALCSSATRARETLSAIAPEVPTVFVDDLYMASPPVIARVIKAAPPEPLILIAHNPGIGAFAAQYAAEPPDHPRFFDYPTAATTVLDFDIESWSDLKSGSGRVRAFVTPHDLPE